MSVNYKPSARLRVAFFVYSKRSITGVALSLLFGCFGAVKSLPTECPETVNVRLAWELTEIKEIEPFNQKREMPTKMDYLEGRGDPVEVLSVSSNKETWVYKEKAWCGYTVVYMMPVPFWLPVCDRVDHITFAEDKVAYIKTTDIHAEGFIFTPSKSGGIDQDNCDLNVKYSEESPLSLKREHVVDTKMKEIRSTTRGRSLMKLPSDISDVLTNIDNNTTLTALMESENWLKVKTPDGDVGWIRKVNIVAVSN